MLPPPPDLFSTMAVWLKRDCKPLAISRATTSLEPPGVNGTTTRIVPFGKPCARTDEIEAKAIAKTISKRAIVPHGVGFGEALVEVARLMHSNPNGERTSTFREPHDPRS